MSYRVVEELHNGARSVLSRAVRESDGRSVVLKELRDLYPDASVLAAFRREFDLQRAAAGPGVAEALDFEVDRGVARIVIADIGASSLARLFEHRRPSLREVLRIACGLARALTRVHAAGVIHKDITPANVLWDPGVDTVQIIDFGIATTVPGAHVQPVAANAFVGTPAFMSPEQTGRMNRAVDQRSDLYSFGATLYWLLTQRPPFDSDDVIDLVHAHIARPPTPPREVERRVPDVLSRITTTLLAKQSGDRYQSAAGLMHDLQTCAEQLEQFGELPDLPLRSRDLREALTIPDALYGRTREVTALRDLVRRTGRGRAEVVLLSGYAGIGKSSLVGEVFRDVSLEGGLFVSGAAEQFQRGQPWGVIVQAFRELVRRIMAEPDHGVDEWRARLLEALGSAGGVVTAVLPELELVIGRQPPVSELSPNETENRIRLALQRLARALGRPDRPTAIFLDDLQWADAASIAFIEHVATDSACRHLLLVGAWRDNEVTDAHPLQRMIDRLRERGTVFTHLQLEPLTVSDTMRLIQGALLRPPDDEVEALAERVQGLTRGNPFYVRRLLEQLAHRGALRVDLDRMQWVIDLSRVADEDIAENVVDFMIDRIRALPEGTRRALEVGAWLGNEFRLDVLATLTGRGRAELQADLAPAVAESLVRPLSDDYWQAATGSDDGAVPDFAFAFVHDRVEQAASALLGHDRAREVRLTAGRMLLGASDARGDAVDALSNDALFDIVGHLGAAADLIADDAERLRVVDLHREAARRAMRSAAYHEAWRYGAMAARLTRSTDWLDRYDETLDLYLAAAESAYLAGEHGAMQALVDAIVERAQAPLDRTRARIIRARACVARNEHARGVTEGIEALAELGVTLPRHPEDADVEAAVGRTLGAVLEVGTHRVLEIGELDDAEAAEARRLAVGISSAAYLAEPALLPLLACSIVESTVTRGVSPESSYGFVVFGLVLCAAGLFEQGYEMGRIAVDLLDRYDDRSLHARVRHVFNTHIRVFRESVATSADVLEDVYQLGLDTGDIEYGCWAAHNHCVFALYAGQALERVERSFERFGPALETHGQMAPWECQRPFEQLVANLRGASNAPAVLHGLDYDAEERITQLEAAGFLGALFLTATAQTIAAVLFDQPTEAARHAARGEAWMSGAAATVHVPIFHFYRALAHLALAQDASDDERQQHVEAAAAARAALAPFAAAAPSNHAHRVALLDARREAIDGNDLAAMNGFDRAASMAADAGHIHDHALALELGGRFHRRCGRDTVARAYLLDARAMWQRLGARGRVDHMNATWGELLRAAPATAPARGRATTISLGVITTTDSTGPGLDMASVFRAHQALSSEMRLDALLEKVMGVIVRSVGGTRGLLLVDRKGRLVVEASSDVDGEEICPRGTLALETDALPATIVQYVARTGEALVLGNARDDVRFQGDPRLQGHGPLSVHCGPVLHKGQRVGMVYLENNVAADAFSDEGVQVISMLGTQAAISLENARLFEEARTMAESFARFVPSEFVRTLGHRGVLDVDVGDAATRDATVLFCDLRGFTRLFEQIGADEGFALLNRYLGAVSPVIERNGGFVDKFIGDAIMALFPGQADGAVRSALEMATAVRSLNASGTLPPGVQLATGAGLHAGPVMLGAVGAQGRLDLTAIGDTVNTASRIEGLTGGMKVSALLSDEVLSRLHDASAWPVRRLGPLRVYGRRQPIAVSELVAVDAPAVRDAKLASLASFDEGMQALREGDGERAHAAFDRCVSACPADGVASVLREMAGVLRSGGTLDESKGSFTPA